MQSTPVPPVALLLLLLEELLLDEEEELAVLLVNVDAPLLDVDGLPFPEDVDAVDAGELEELEEPPVLAELGDPLLPVLAGEDAVLLELDANPELELTELEDTEVLNEPDEEEDDEDVAGVPDDELEDSWLTTSRLHSPSMHWRPLDVSQSSLSTHVELGSQPRLSRATPKTLACNRSRVISPRSIVRNPSMRPDAGQNAVSLPFI